jgi:hypothetical protein
MIGYRLSHEEELSKFSLRPSNDIYLFSNVFSEDMCNKLIDYTNKNAKYHLKLGPLQNVQGYEKIIEENDTFFKHISSKIVDIGKFINKKYNIPFGNYNNYKYEHTERLAGNNPIGLEKIQMRKIYGPTKIHMDSPLSALPVPCSCCHTGDKMISVKGVRDVSIIIALNGDYDGGEIVFPCQNFKTKLKQGEAILFPPYWTHPHYTEDLKNNTFRYTINTWLTV